LKNKEKIEKNAGEQKSKTEGRRQDGKNHPLVKHQGRGSLNPVREKEHNPGTSRVDEHKEQRASTKSEFVTKGKSPSARHPD